MELFSLKIITLDTPTFFPPIAPYRTTDQGCHNTDSTNRQRFPRQAFRGRRSCRSLFDVGSNAIQGSRHLVRAVQVPMRAKLFSTIAPLGPLTCHHQDRSPIRFISQISLSITSEDRVCQNQNAMPRHGPTMRTCKLPSNQAEETDG